MAFEELPDVLKAAGVSLVAYVPDAGHAGLIRAAHEDPAFTPVSPPSDSVVLHLARLYYSFNAYPFYLHDGDQRERDSDVASKRPTSGVLGQLGVGVLANRPLGGRSRRR